MVLEMFSVRSVDTAGVYVVVYVEYPNKEINPFRFIKENKPSEKYIEECKFLALNEAKANFSS